MPTDGPSPATAHDLAGLTRICDFVAHHARVTPDHEAVVFGAERFSYAELDEAADRCAHGLGALGVGAGDRIAMLTTPRPEFVITLLAAQRLGAIWVGLNPAYRRAELSHIVQDCRPRMLVSLTESDRRDYVEDLRALAGLGVEAVATIPAAVDGLSVAFPALLEGAGADFEQAFHPDDPTVIVYTSGTTGRPKGALLSHRNLLFSYRSVSRSFAGREALRDDLRLLCNLPPNHIGCLSEMVGNTLIRGGTLVLAERFDAAEALAAIARERITLFGGVPPMLQAMFDHPDFARTELSSVRMIGWGGAPAPQVLIERMQALGAHLFTNYGLTEGGAVVCATGPQATVHDLADTVGTPFDPGEARIVDGQGADVAPGEAGEVWLRGDGVFLGYWNDPGATAAAFAPGRWLKTGDIAAARPDGAWTLHGRIAEMFKSGGYNVYPREVELALEEHPDVAAAVVVAIADPIYFEVGHAFVTPRPGRTLEPDAVLGFLRQRLANYKVPKAAHVRERLPLLAIGKVDKAALRAAARAAATGAPGR